MKQDTAPTDDPRIEAAVERYRKLLETAEGKETPLDTVLEASLPDPIRSRMLRRLLVEERKSRRQQRLSTSFETYFSRVWFERCIDDLVAVILEKEYVVEGRLGAGGQGRVYKVRNRSVHNRKEALKVFLPADPQYLKEFDYDQYLSLEGRFDRESEALSKVQLDHLPSVYAVGVRDGLRFFTMEYVVGSSLAKVLEEKVQGSIEPRQAARWMLTVAETLEVLHRDKILHRDLKPSNLILNEKGKLYIVDFGLVKLMPGARQGTSSFRNDGDLTASQGYGSRGYVSPEQAMNASIVTAATDAYSLGATFFHLLNGFPFSGEDGPVRWAPQVPEELREICAACLRLDAEERPSVAKVAERLRDWIQESERLEALPPMKPSRRLWLYLAGGSS